MMAQQGRNQDHRAWLAAALSPESGVGALLGPIQEHRRPPIATEWGEAARFAGGAETGLLSNEAPGTGRPGHRTRAGSGCASTQNPSRSPKDTPVIRKRGSHSAAFAA